MTKRMCVNCRSHVPPETEHFEIDNDIYCKDCVDVTPYTAYIYEVNGDFMGTSEDDRVQHIEEYDDLYEEE